MNNLITILKSRLLWGVLICTTIFLLIREVRVLNKEIGRMGNNQRLLQQSQQEILLNNGRTASQTGVLLLHQKELTDLFPDLRKEIGLLNVRMNGLQSLSTAVFTQQKQFSTGLKDSIVFSPLPTFGLKDTRSMQYDTLSYKVFSYHDEYYDVSGIAHLDEQLVKISSRDTMMQVVYRKRKNRWLWIFSPRVLEQRVYFKNPNAHIEYSRTINIAR